MTFFVSCHLVLTVLRRQLALCRDDYMETELQRLLVLENGDGAWNFYHRSSCHFFHSSNECTCSDYGDNDIWHIVNRLRMTNVLLCHRCDTFKYSGFCSVTKPKNRRFSVHAGATVTGNLSQIKTKAKLSPEVSEKGWLLIRGLRRRRYRYCIWILVSSWALCNPSNGIRHAPLSADEAWQRTAYQLVRRDIILSTQGQNVVALIIFTRKNIKKYFYIYSNIYIELIYIYKPIIFSKILLT